MTTLRRELYDVVSVTAQAKKAICVKRVRKNAKSLNVLWCTESNEFVGLISFSTDLCLFLWKVNSKIIILVSIVIFIALIRMP